MLYQWIKALHVIADIAWMAGLLYLPRLFVYHCAAEPGSVQSETFKVMERRLLRGIMNPAMVVAWACGLTMIALNPALLRDGGWLHVKLTLVMGLTLCHMALVRWRQAFAQDRNTHSQRFFRLINEVPTLLMVGVVVMVIVKPF